MLPDKIINKSTLLLCLGLALSASLPAAAGQWQTKEWVDGKKPIIPAAAARAAPIGSGGGKSSGYVLRGSIEHVEQLPPTSKDLRPGMDFRPSSIPQVSSATDWYRIPEWFAGTFRVEQSVVAKTYDYSRGRTIFLNRKIKTSGEETRGYQRDAHGDIWQMSTTSGTTRSEDRSRIIYNIIRWCGPAEITAERVVMRVQATSVFVSKKTGQIESVLRRDDIKTYTPLKPGVVSVSYTSKSFSPSGAPLDLQTGFSIHKLVAAFQPVDVVAGQNLKKAFRQYLTSQNLQDLIPEN